MKMLLRGLLHVSSWLFSLGITFAILGVLLAVAVFHVYNKDLPDYTQLANYDPPTTTRLYAADGKLMAEYATEKRVFVPLSAMPKRVIAAFLSAEDKNFYSHTGVDITGVARAIRDNVINYGQGKSLVGGSTITQQVVKNFLLTNEKSLERKVKEAILALRITHVYSKDKILELYLNEIYLGSGSYGVVAAAQNYFAKSLDELTIEESAFLATLPKAPALYNPKRNYDTAFERRNWVISRMQEDGIITQSEAEQAAKLPITLHERDVAEVARADFFAEEVRRWLVDKYGADVLYQSGLVVKTTLNPTYQTYADRALQKALISYDRRRGYRGPLAKIEDIAKAKTELTVLQKIYAPQLIEGQKLAVVSAVDAKQATLIFDDGSSGTIPFALMKWARLVIADGKLGKEIRKPADILSVKDVVMVSAAPGEKNQWDLQQVPQVNGAIVVLDPHTGRVLAMSGGYSYGKTEFNRATQAHRQPGSAFKPFVYMAALENNLTPASIIMDAPIELNQGAGQPAWRPENYGNDFLGPTTLRVGLEKSRNTMSVRIAQLIGVDKCMEIGKRFGIYDAPARNLSIVLGTGETTLLKLANAYGIIANGGKQISPSFIERIDDRRGTTIFRRDERVCEECKVEIGETMPANMAPPVLPDEREWVVDPRIAYQITSILEGVVQRGTATRAKVLGKVVAGKTGTTNNSFDTWFVGFTPDLVAGVYIGYDQPKTLGAKETGGSVALPAFINFMQEALANTTNKPFKVPRGIQFVKTDLHTGWPVGMLEEGEVQGAIINEAFIAQGPVYVPGITPKSVLDMVDALDAPSGSSVIAPPAPTPPPVGDDAFEAENPHPKPAPLPQVEIRDTPDIAPTTTGNGLY